jgi:hypothetical protein
MRNCKQELRVLCEPAAFVCSFCIDVKLLLGGVMTLYRVMITMGAPRVLAPTRHSAVNTVQKGRSSLIEVIAQACHLNEVVLVPVGRFQIFRREMRGVAYPWAKQGSRIYFGA